MKKNIEFVERADAYIRGQMSEEERRSFEDYCKLHPEEASSYEQHILLLKKLNEYQKRINFRSKLEAAYTSTQRELPVKGKTVSVVKLWKSYGDRKSTRLNSSHVK